MKIKNPLSLSTLLLSACLDPETDLFEKETEDSSDFSDTFDIEELPEAPLNILCFKDHTCYLQVDVGIFIPTLRDYELSLLTKGHRLSGQFNPCGDPLPEDTICWESTGEHLCYTKLDNGWYAKISPKCEISDLVPIWGPVWKDSCEEELLAIEHLPFSSAYCEDGTTSCWADFFEGWSISIKPLCEIADKEPLAPRGC